MWDGHACEEGSGRLNLDHAAHRLVNGSIGKSQESILHGIKQIRHGNSSADIVFAKPGNRIATYKIIQYILFHKCRYGVS
jgi:hypothetical protein